MNNQSNEVTTTMLIILVLFAGALVGITNVFELYDKITITLSYSPTDLSVLLQCVPSLLICCFLAGSCVILLIKSVLMKSYLIYDHERFLGIFFATIGFFLQISLFAFQIDERWHNVDLVLSSVLVLGAGMLLVARSQQSKYGRRSAIIANVTWILGIVLALLMFFNEDEFLTMFYPRSQLYLSLTFDMLLIVWIGLLVLLYFSRFSVQHLSDVGNPR